MDSDDDDDDPDGETCPVKLVINAAHSIQGSHNIISTSPTPLGDATRFSTLLMHAINQINVVNGNAAGGQSASRRPLKVDLTINCGITVVGDRNVVGNVGVRPKTPAGATAPPEASTTSTAAVAGAKRKSEEAELPEESATKKVAHGGEGGD